MNRNAISIPRQSSSKRKRKVEPISYFKKLRSKIPRRKRFHISPILVGSSNSLISDKKPGILAIPAVSSSSSYFTEEVSCTSSWISVGSNDLKKKPRSSRRKRAIEEVRGSEVVSQLHERSCRQPGKIPDEQFRRITRSYYRQKENVRTIRKKGDGNFGVALSESSCVEPSSAADAAIACKSDEFADRNLKLKSRSRNGAETEKESEGMAASTAITLSGSSFSQPISQENVQSLYKAGEVSGELCKPRAKGAGNSPAIPDNEAISEISCVESLSEAKNQNVCPSAGETSKKVTKDEGKRAPEAEFSGLSRNYVESNLAVSISESTAEKKPKDFDFDSDFACSENLSYEDDSDYSTSHELTLSELEPFFSNNSDVEITDEWLCLESPRDFSERSAGNSTPSASFSLFLQYTLQFSKSSSHPDVGVSSRLKEEYLDDCTLLRFEDEEHEESYKNFRSRERRQVFLYDYTEDYFLTTEFGDLVLQQRLLMVNWIIEQSNAKELQSETLFLGVSLLDRFLSRGFFKQRRSLQIVGIACLTLAIRMEENQPYNCVRQKVFHVGSNVYSRCEVVAMEWQVQKVLNFQCFLPTTYNFLWFYLKAAKADAEVEKRAKYLAVLSLMDHEQLCYWPSTVAAGLVILASLASNHDSSCQSVMETHVRTKNDDLPECIQSLEWLVKYVC